MTEQIYILSLIIIGLVALMAMVIGLEVYYKHKHHMDKHHNKDKDNNDHWNDWYSKETIKPNGDGRSTESLSSAVDRGKAKNKDVVNFSSQSQVKDGIAIDRLSRTHHKF